MDGNNAVHIQLQPFDIRQQIDLILVRFIDGAVGMGFNTLNSSASIKVFCLGR